MIAHLPLPPGCATDALDVLKCLNMLEVLNYWTVMNSTDVDRMKWLNHTICLLTKRFKQFSVRNSISATFFCLTYPNKIFKQNVSCVTWKFAHHKITFLRVVVVLFVVVVIRRSGTKMAKQMPPMSIVLSTAAIIFPTTVSHMGNQ